MITMQHLDELLNVIQFADALTFLGANNTHQDMTGEDCAVLIGAISERLTHLAEQMEKELKARH